MDQWRARSYCIGLLLDVDKHLQLLLGPTMHLLFWLQDPISVKRNMDDNKKSARLKQFIVHESHTIARDFEKSLAANALFDEQVFGPIWEIPGNGLPTDSEVVGNIVLEVLRVGFEYHWRIHLDTKRFPMLLAWLVFHPPYYDSLFRTGVANKMFDLRAATAEPPDDETDIVWKLVDLFEIEFRAAVDYGTVCVDLHDLVDLISRIMMPDTQEIDGCDSMIKYTIKLAPRIDPDLLAARVSNKKVMFQNPTPSIADRRALVQCIIDSHAEAVYTLKGLRPLKPNLPDNQLSALRHHLEDELADVMSEVDALAQEVEQTTSQTTAQPGTHH